MHPGIHGNFCTIHSQKFSYRVFNSTFGISYFPLTVLLHRQLTNFQPSKNRSCLQSAFSHISFNVYRTILMRYNTCTAKLDYPYNVIHGMLSWVVTCISGIGSWGITVFWGCARIIVIVILHRICTALFICRCSSWCRNWDTCPFLLLSILGISFCRQVKASIFRIGMTFLGFFSCPIRWLSFGVWRRLNRDWAILGLWVLTCHSPYTSLWPTCLPWHYWAFDFWRFESSDHTNYFPHKYNLLSHTKYTVPRSYANQFLSSILPLWCWCHFSLHLVVWGR